METSSHRGAKTHSAAFHINITPQRDGHALAFIVQRKGNNQLKGQFMKISKGILTSSVSAFLIFPAMGFANDRTEAKQPDTGSTKQFDEFNRGLNAGDQGTSKSDMELTQKIRQAIVKRETLSTEAKNVTVITANGMVTLKGQVKSSNERLEIGQIARDTAGDGQVTNQIEVR